MKVPRKIANAAFFDFQDLPVMLNITQGRTESL
jgi:hypothetical protein